MWRLTIKQKNEHGNFNLNNEVHFDDENQNNLIDMVRYLAEYKIPKDTEFILAEVKDGCIQS